jgi:biopolymer transport protein ExbD
MERPMMPIAPMIDCVFLMLVYFMTTSSLERSEADLECPLSGPALSAAMPLEAVDEQWIHVDPGGSASWNGSVYALADGADKAVLQSRLEAFKTASLAAGGKPRLVIEPEDGTMHQMVVHILDAAEAAGLRELELR